MLGELVEESVFAIVGGPDGDVVGPSDPALGGLPQELGIGMHGEFIEADIAAINGHGVRIGRKGNDAGAVLEFDIADSDFFGNGSNAALRIEIVNFDVVLAMTEHVAGVAEEIGEVVNLVHVFEGTGQVPGDEEIIAPGKAETFADIFEAVTEGPADADGFFGQGADLFFGFVKGVFRADPTDLIRSEVFGKERVGVYFDEGEDGGHR